MQHLHQAVGEFGPVPGHQANLSNLSTERTGPSIPVFRHKRLLALLVLTESDGPITKIDGIGHPRKPALLRWEQIGHRRLRDRRLASRRKPAIPPISPSGSGSSWPLQTIQPPRVASTQQSPSGRGVPLTAWEPAGACGQHEDADGEVAPQHADVDGPQTAQAGRDGFDTTVPSCTG